MWKYFSLSRSMALLPLAIVGLSLFVSVSSAYINGGDYRNSLGKFEETLKSQGWSVGSSAPMLADDRRVLAAFKGILLDPSDKPEFQKFVKQLVAKSIQLLHPDEAAQVTDEMRDKLVEHAGRAIEAAVLKRAADSSDAQIGPFECRAGTGEFQTWWETKYGGKLEIHAKKSGGIIPFVAIRRAKEN